MADMRRVRYHGALRGPDLAARPAPGLADVSGGDVGGALGGVLPGPAAA
jgi:hypothetical protein